MNTIKKNNMRNVYLTIIFIAISINLFPQKMTKYFFDSLTKNIDFIPYNFPLSKVKSSKMIDYKTYNQLINNYPNYYEVYCYNQTGKKYHTTWSGIIKGDSVTLNVDNTDENGSVIPGKPDIITVKNEISILGKFETNNNITVLAIKIEQYHAIYVDIFSYNENGTLLSVIPAVYIEKARDNSGDLILSNCTFLEEKKFDCFYISELKTKVNYVITNDGRFKDVLVEVINE